MRVLLPAMAALLLTACITEDPTAPEPDLSRICYPDDWLHPCEPKSDTVYIEIVIPNP